GKEPTTLVQTAYGEKDFPVKLSNQQDISSHPVFAHDDLPKKPIQPDEIEIDVRAHGVNRGHTWKRVADGLLLGECAGIVTKLGSAIGGFDIGDRVCAVNSAPFPSKVRIGNVGNSFANRLPPTMPFTTAASLPTAFMSAYYALVKMAQVEGSSIVLISNATSPVGQAGILLARSIGATVLAIVSSSHQRSSLIETFGLPPAQVFFSGSILLKEQIVRFNSGRGVDCIMDVAKSNLDSASQRWLAPYGFLVQIPDNDHQLSRPSDLASIAKGATYTSLHLPSFIQDRPPEAAQILQSALSMITEEMLELYACQVTTMPISDISIAFQSITEPILSTKTVLQADEGMLVDTIRADGVDKRLKSDATYIVAGGTGDFGRRLLRLMASRGAKHIVALSRTQYKREEQGNARIRWPSFNVLDAKCHVVSCDIFVLLSSATSLIGTRGSANHAAGNIFQDAFAFKCPQSSCRCVSANIGGVIENATVNTPA
ncbi:MAG: hypothetical protein Q9164_006046, partial [Protoblastenia rupestris]